MTFRHTDALHEPLSPQPELKQAVFQWGCSCRRFSSFFSFSFSSFSSNPPKLNIASLNTGSSQTGSQIMLMSLLLLPPPLANACLSVHGHHSVVHSCDGTPLFDRCRLLLLGKLSLNSNAAQGGL
jgi:hypothetical protein